MDKKAPDPGSENFIKHDLPIHEDQRNVGIESLVEILDLLNRKIQKGEVVSHRDHRLRSAEKQSLIS